MIKMNQMAKMMETPKEMQAYGLPGSIAQDTQIDRVLVILFVLLKIFCVFLLFFFFNFNLKN